MRATEAERARESATQKKRSTTQIFEGSAQTATVRSGLNWRMREIGAESIRLNWQTEPAERPERAWRESLGRLDPPGR